MITLCYYSNQELDNSHMITFPYYYNQEIGKIHMITFPYYALLSHLLAMPTKECDKGGFANLLSGL